MSFVSLLSWQLQNINNMYRGQAMFMGSSNNLMKMLENPLKYSPEQALKQEQQYMQNSLIGQTMYKAAVVQQEGVQKMLDESIKRSFSYFA